MRASRAPWLALLSALALFLGGVASRLPRSTRPAAAESVAAAASSTPPGPARPAAAPVPRPPSAPRATTWVVLRVARDAPAEVVTTVHKDALPYAAPPEGPTRYRLIEPDGSELTGPCAWPRLCPCAAPASHTRGCVRRHHTASVRLRLPRLRGPSRVVIERRAGAGWAELTRVELDV